MNPANIRSDFEQVYQWGAKHTQVDAKKIVVFAHSEGSVHVAHLASEKRIQPKGMVFMGGLYESPKATVAWQMKGRLPALLLNADTDKNGQVTHQEIKAYYYKEPRLQIFPMTSLLPQEKFWTKEALEKTFASQYTIVKNNALMSKDTELFKSGTVVQASMAWWKMFFIDDISPALLLAKSNTPVINHIGTVDSQVDLTRQKKVLMNIKMAHQLKVKAHEKKGHALGAHALMGPISDESQATLVQSMIELLNSEAP